MDQLKAEKATSTVTHHPFQNLVTDAYQCFDLIDKNKDGKIQMDEAMYAAVGNCHSDKAGQVGRLMLGLSERKKNGQIDPDDYFNIELIKELHKDNDGWFFSESGVTKNDLSALGDIIDGAERGADLNKLARLKSEDQCLNYFIKYHLDIADHNMRDPQMTVDDLTKLSKDNEAPQKLKAAVSLILSHKDELKEPGLHGGFVTEMSIKALAREIHTEKEKQESMQKWHDKFYAKDFAGSASDLNDLLQDGKCWL